MFEEEDYWRAVRALYRRVNRWGFPFIWQQPNHSLTTITKKGILVLRNVNGELGRYDTRKNRLVRKPWPSVN